MSPPLEFEYYNNPKTTTSWPDEALCAYYAGFASGAMGLADEHLATERKSVLSIYHDCRTNGAISLIVTATSQYVPNIVHSHH
jgi:hypothetical protein